MPQQIVPADLLRQLDELTRRVRALETAPRAQSTSIEDGAFKVYDGNGVLRAVLGTLGGNYWGLYLYNASGQLAATFGTALDATNVGLQVFRPSGANLFQVDDRGLVGVAQPGIPFLRTNESDSVANTSAAEYLFRDVFCTGKRLQMETTVTTAVQFTQTVTWDTGLGEVTVDTQSRNTNGSIIVSVDMPDGLDDVGLYGRLRVKWHVASSFAAARLISASFAVA